MRRLFSTNNDCMVLLVPIKLVRIDIFLIQSFYKDFIYLFLETGEGRVKESERNIECGCLTGAPYWGPGLLPRHIPWLGIESAILWFTGWCSIHWPTPARALFLFLCTDPEHLLWYTYRSFLLLCVCLLCYLFCMLFGLSNLQI